MESVVYANYLMRFKIFYNKMAYPVKKYGHITYSKSMAQSINQEAS